MVFSFRRKSSRSSDPGLPADPASPADESFLLKQEEEGGKVYNDSLLSVEDGDMEESKTHRLRQPKTEETTNSRQVPRLRAPPSSKISLRQSMRKNQQKSSLVEAPPTTPVKLSPFSCDKQDAAATVVTPDTDQITVFKTPTSSVSGGGGFLRFSRRGSSTGKKSRRSFLRGRSIDRTPSDNVETSPQRRSPMSQEQPPEPIELDDLTLDTPTARAGLNHDRGILPPPGITEAHELLKTLSFKSTTTASTGDENQSVEIMTQVTERQRYQLLQRQPSTEGSILREMSERNDADASMSSAMFSNQKMAPSPISRVSSAHEQQRQAKPAHPGILRSPSRGSKKKMDPPGSNQEADGDALVDMNTDHQPIRSSSRQSTGSSADEWQSEDAYSRGSRGTRRTTDTGTDYGDTGTYDDRTNRSDGTSLPQELKQVLNDTAQKIIDTFRCHPNLSAKQVLANPTGVMSLFYDKLCTPQQFGAEYSRRPYYNEAFTREWLHKMTTVGMSILYLQAPHTPGNDMPEWKGRTVQLMIAAGTTGNLLDIQPKLEWSTMAGGRANVIFTTSIPLLKIHSVITDSDTTDGDPVAVAGTGGAGGCFLTVTSGNGDVHIFEANSAYERNDLLNGLRNVIARLSFHLITGDATASVELYRDEDGLEEGDLPSLPNPRLNMNRISHALLDG